MSSPICPQCGSLMVLRTAKKGPKSGEQFYGCSSYPQCKQTLRIDEVNNQSLEKQDCLPGKSLVKNTFPRRLFARSIKQGCEVQLFESAAIPFDIIEDISYDENPHHSLNPFVQWRVDYPSREIGHNLSMRQRQVLSVAQKVLTRGRVTLCSPFLETTLKKYFLKSESEHLQLKSIKEAFICPFHPKYQNIWLDSPAESRFYEDILSTNIGRDYSHWILPQVEITSLVPQGTEVPAKGRVDFLVSHPVITPIVVEIDGEGHRIHKDEDDQRDAILSRHGYTVIRIPVTEIDESNGPNLSKLENLLTTLKNRNVPDYNADNDIAKYIWSLNCAHHIQLVLLQGIKTGYLNLISSDSWFLYTDLGSLGFFTGEEALHIFQSAVSDFLQLLRNLANLYSTECCVGDPQVFGVADLEAENTGINISFGNNDNGSIPTFNVSNIYVPIKIAQEVFSVDAAVLDSPAEETLEYFLNYLFRKPSFWEGQLDTISRALQGKDAIVLLPTGSGKSIAFQLAALLLPGTTVVIDPIIALMDDQIDNLASVGIDRCIAITGQISDAKDRSQAINLFGQGEYVLVYIAPERFQTEEFRKSLRSLTIHTPIDLIVVDEAHCVSEWGHDFRTAYLNIGRITRQYCTSRGYIPALIALTGTASRAVLKDIQRELQVEDFESIITPKSFDRSELNFHIIDSTSDEKQACLSGFLGQKLPNIFGVVSSTFFQTRGGETYSGLVFCPHVNGSFGVVEVANQISATLGIDASHYSGKKPKMRTETEWNKVKHITAKRYKRNEFPLLVCTKAFGMGIDKPNIRYTVHFGIPASIEAFYQEAGRAGRDRKRAHCCILVSNDNPDRTKHLLNPNTPSEEIADIIERIPWDDNSDITRSFFFLTKAFPGVTSEKRHVEQILQKLPDLDTEKSVVLAIPSLPRNTIEKGLHRLLVLGIIKDYTINYSSNEFSLKVSGASKEEIVETFGKYVSGYIGARRDREVQKASEFLNLPYDQFVIEMVDLLLNFIYNVIEKGRRRALQEMLLAATENPTDQAIRERILKYLEATKFSEVISDILDQADVGIAQIKEMFKNVRSPNEAAELRGQVSRALESYPDHPGLLMLRSLSEISCRDRNHDTAGENFLASFTSAKENYGIEEELLNDFVAWSASQLSEKDLSFGIDLIHNIIKDHPDRILARNLVKYVPEDVVDIPAWFLLDRITEKCINL